MYKCLDCGSTFERPDEWEETHGFSRPPYEHFDGCPYCHGAFEEYTEPEPYEPDLAEISKKIIEGIFKLNNFRYSLEDMFGGAVENEDLEKGYDLLFDALDILTAPEGMDEAVSERIMFAKSNNDFMSATDNFLEGAGLK